ncbi:hypothetical protein Tco_0629913 [Tanacetum coccineum]|uniref:Uncharacterized protein n=1 Tax=Tanacetum coccineum TaxID=301880 RepID=A0ABQ4WV65_9ASTR
MSGVLQKQPAKSGRPKKNVGNVESGGDATINMDESSSQVRQGGVATGSFFDHLAHGIKILRTGPGSVGVQADTNVGSGGVDPGTNMGSVGVERSEGNDTVRSASLGNFVSVRCEGTTTATTSRGGLGVRRGRGGQTVGLRVRRVTSEGTPAARIGRGGHTLGVRRGTSGSTSTVRGRGGQTLGLRVRRGIGFRGAVAQGVRYGRLGRWFRLEDETQKETNEQPTPVTQQSQAGIQQEPQAAEEGRQAQANKNIQRGN